MGMEEPLIPQKKYKIENISGASSSPVISFVLLRLLTLFSPPPEAFIHIHLCCTIRVQTIHLFYSISTFPSLYSSHITFFYFHICPQTLHTNTHTHTHTHTHNLTRLYMGASESRIEHKISLGIAQLPL